MFGNIFIDSYAEDAPANPSNQLPHITASILPHVTENTLEVVEIKHIHTNKGKATNTSKTGCYTKKTTTTTTGNNTYGSTWGNSADGTCNIVCTYCNKEIVSYSTLTPEQFFKDNGPCPTCKGKATTTVYKCEEPEVIAWISFDKVKTDEGYYVQVSTQSSKFTSPLLVLQIDVTAPDYSSTGGVNGDGKIKVTSNGTYSVSLQLGESLTGGKTKKTVTFDIDDYLQIYSITPSTHLYTADNIMLDVQGCGIEEYSLDGENWITTNDLSVSENGTYTVYVKAGDTVLYDNITISNIDKGKPVVTYVNNSPSTWTNQDVSISISGTDDLSGIQKYLLNGEEVNENANISENGEYTLIAVDNVGNESEPVTFRIENIDKSIPELSSSLFENGNEYICGKWATSDVYVSIFDHTYHESGVGCEVYCNGTYMTKLTPDEEYKIEDVLDHSGLYVFKFITGAGNSEMASFNVMIDKKAPIITDIIGNKSPTKSLQVQPNAYDPEG